jgi:phosphoribosylformylglycinamidine synthase
MNSVMEHAAKGGYVFGVCNGFQILCESGLVDGALLHNNSQKFICKNVHIKPISTNTIVTSQLDLTRAYQVPIAHGEGRFFADADTIKKLHDNNQILFKYCDASGNINEASNPNGTLENIAGICNKNRNVFGMMPHPERASDAELGNVDGYEIFRSILESTVLA